MTERLAGSAAATVASAFGNVAEDRERMTC
jgi:hypothetical protein